MAFQSRSEKILRSIIDKTEYTEEPKSRMEDLLLKVKKSIDEGGGGGGGPSEDQDFEPTDVDDIMSVISTDNDDE